MNLEFNGGCWKQDKITYNHGKIVKIYIVYDLKSTLNYNTDFNLENCLFRVVKLTKNVDVNNTNILHMALDLMEKEFFHVRLVVLVIT